MLHTPERFHAWEAIHGDLPWEGAFAPMNRTAEKLGSDPTSGNPNRIVEAAFKAGVPNTTVADSTNAATFMVQMVRKYPGQVSIYSAGALTNVALAARMDADFASLAKELVIMGGYVDVNMLKATGNHEVANINNDVCTLIPR
jgi:inosine-uridine nucleoside N-ribohydrolase